jgi:hypothetical protein
MTGLEYLIENCEYFRGDHDDNIHIGLKLDDFMAAEMQDKIYRTYTVDKQVEILQDVLNELMTGFESPEDRWDFILDIVNGYKDRILTNK